jgi:hypothetical protein
MHEEKKQLTKAAFSLPPTSHQKRHLLSQHTDAIATTHQQISLHICFTAFCILYLLLHFRISPTAVRRGFAVVLVPPQTPEATPSPAKINMNYEGISSWKMAARNCGKNFTTMAALRDFKMS